MKNLVKKYSVNEEFIEGNENNIINLKNICSRKVKYLTKDEILELYFNEIYLGYGSYGVASASLNYFNKSLEELNFSTFFEKSALFFLLYDNNFICSLTDDAFFTLEFILNLVAVFSIPFFS